MYLAGMIAEPNKMTIADFNRWIEGAYFYMISDFIVAVTLSETDLAFTVVDSWINCDKELKASAGWNCYNWLLGSRDDNQFEKVKLLNLLYKVRETIHEQPNRVKYAMNNFIMTVGLSYLPLHEEAKVVAQEVGTVDMIVRGKPYQATNALDYIQREVDKGRLGFKRKYVRC
jgi:hypothetical protein